MHFVVSKQHVVQGGVKRTPRYSDQNKKKKNDL